MAVMKCKMCGGDLNVTEGVSVVECEYCGSRQTIPNQDSEKKLTLFARADRLRRANEFDKAAGVYESIVAEFPEEAEAYWGLVLCRYGIEYVDDPATGKKVPTCHRSSFDSILEDADFDQACENADPIARRQYREEAKAIEGIRKGILEVSSKEEPYDIFICYKETDENGGRTIDSVIAQDVYDALTEKGYRVFFSRISLEDKLGTEYEPYIFAALNSAKVMLAFGTDFEYFNAVWVKNEWSRFLALIAAGQKKTLIPCYKNLDAYDMPKEFQRLQAQDMGKVGAMQDLLRGIGKIIPREADVKETVVVQQGAAPAGPGVESLLKRGYTFLEDGDWAKADEYFDKVLDIQLECGEAYAGKLCAEMGYRRLSDIAEDADSWDEGIGTGEITKDPVREILDQIEKKETINAIRLLREATGIGLAEGKRAIECIRPNTSVAEAAKIFGIKRMNELYNKVQRFGSEALKAEIAGYIAQAQSRRAERERQEEEAETERRRQEAEAEAEMRRQEEDAHSRALAALAEKRRDLAPVARLIMMCGFQTIGLKCDGTVAATGLNAGNPSALSGWWDIVAADAGGDHTVGLKADGTVVAVGNNIWGQCNVGSWRDIAAVDAGAFHTVGLKSDGTVEAVGDNEDGKCNVSGWRDIVAVYAGAYSTVGLKSDGTVVAVGENEYGACNVSSWRDIVAVSTESGHTVGLKSDGTVVAVGDNKDGQCNVSGWQDIVAVSAGGLFTVGLKSDGTVVAVGNNNWGQCYVSGWRNIVAVCASGRNTVGLRSDGTVLVAGDNEKGQCNVSGWKLFNSMDTLREEQQAARANARMYRQRKAAEAEAARQAKIDALEREKQSLQAELPTLKGLFSGGKRRQIEARLAQIEAELNSL